MWNWTCRCLSAQAAAAAYSEFNGTVTFVSTTDFARPAEESPNTGHGHHWYGNAESYFLIGNALGEGMEKLLMEAQSRKGPLKVFILAGQSNMDGQANVKTIDFLGEDKEHGALLKTFKPNGKTMVTVHQMVKVLRLLTFRLAQEYRVRYDYLKVS